jgi:adenylate kinase family enzyme
MLVGSGGASKSTLARELGVRLRLPVYHLDALLWQPGWVMTPKDQERAFFADLVKQS